jgi:tRNA dimethylallyltransferase
LAASLGNLELVSVDSMSVYRSMDLGTAKPLGPDRAAAVWHGLDLVDPSVEFSVADFAAAVSSATASISRRGHLPLFVGGTGLYHRAALGELELAPRFPEIVTALEARETPELFARLVELDDVAARRVQPANRRRILRALEVTLGTGRPFSCFGPGLEHYPATGVTLIGLEHDQAALDVALSARLDRQLAAGLLDEVRWLLDRPEGWSRTARQALGYRELALALEPATTERLELSAAVHLAKARLRRFARRQRSWFARDPRVHWIAADRSDLVEAVLAEVRAIVDVQD